MSFIGFNSCSTLADRAWLSTFVPPLASMWVIMYTFELLTCYLWRDLQLLLSTLGGVL